MDGLVHQVERLTEQRFWAEFATDLHVADADYLRTQHCFTVDAATGHAGQALLKKEGYFQLDPPDWQLPTLPMSALVEKLGAAALPVPFAFMYDEFWSLFYRLNHVVGALLGDGFLRLPDFWTWLIDPRQSDSGWRPHRDKGHWALFADGTPKSVTAWITLGESTPMNGCMYIVPADRDPTYGTPDDGTWQFAYADIRALPAQAGSIFIWNQAVLHWGAHASEREVTPRISCAFEFQSSRVPAFNQPLTDPFTFPDFTFRLGLIAKQILQYKHMYPLSADVEACANRIAEHWRTGVGG